MQLGQCVANEAPWRALHCHRPPLVSMLLMTRQWCTLVTWHRKWMKVRCIASPIVLTCNHPFKDEWLISSHKHLPSKRATMSATGLFHHYLPFVLSWHVARRTGPLFPPLFALSRSYATRPASTHFRTVLTNLEFETSDCYPSASVPTRNFAQTCSTRSDMTDQSKWAESIYEQQQTSPRMLN